MLHKDPVIISQAAFDLIQQLQNIPELKEFYLVGGTALALQLGHRNSIDIDLFTLKEFDDGDIIELINKQYDISEIFRRRNKVICLVAMIAMKAVNFFDDIDENIDPQKLLKPLPLKKIVTRIREATQKPDKIFNEE
ncbi:MAG: nucleotidyl transferase AbiEii/AbiGii toxin family protein [Ginsengibacter sp.]